MTGDIVAFVRARLAEDERIAREASAGYLPGAREWVVVQPECNVVRTAGGGRLSGTLVVKWTWPNEAVHIAHHDPARVLRGVEAKRRMLDEFELCQACLVGERCVPHDASAGQPGVSRIASAQHEWFARLLASEWSTHPDYRTEWTL